MIQYYLVIAVLMLVVAYFRDRSLVSLRKGFFWVPQLSPGLQVVAAFVGEPT